MNMVDILGQKGMKKLYRDMGITYVGVFGSQVRGDDTPRSDVDLLIDFRQIKSLFELAEVKLKLEKVLKKKVDLALRGKLKPSLKPYIMRDLVDVYEED